MHSTLRRLSLCLALTLSGPALAGEAGEPRKPACEPGSRPSLKGCSASGDRVKVRSSRAAEPREEPSREAAAPSPVDLGVRAPPLAAKSRELLIREIARLEPLVKKTPRRSPERPVLVRRLAENYAELAAIAERDKIRAETAASQAREADDEPRKPPAKREVERR